MRERIRLLISLLSTEQYTLSKLLLLRKTHLGEWSDLVKGMRSPGFHWLRTPVISDWLTAHMLTKVSLDSFYLSGSSLTFPKAKKLLSFNLIRRSRDLGRPRENIHNRALQVFMTAYHPTQSCQIIPRLRLLLPSNHALVISSFNSDYSGIIFSLTDFLNSHWNIFSYYADDAIHLSHRLDCGMVDRQLKWGGKASNCDDNKYHSCPHFSFFSLGKW